MEIIEIFLRFTFWLYFMDKADWLYFEDVAGC